MTRAYLAWSLSFLMLLGALLIADAHMIYIHLAKAHSGSTTHSFHIIEVALLGTILTARARSIWIHVASPTLGWFHFCIMAQVLLLGALLPALARTIWIRLNRLHLGWAHTFLIMTVALFSVILAAGAHKVHVTRASPSWTRRAFMTGVLHVTILVARARLGWIHAMNAELACTPALLGATLAAGADTI